MILKEELVRIARLNNLRAFQQDFTMVKKLDLKYLPVEVEKDLEVYGIDSEIRILKDDGISFSFRIGAKGPLFTKEIEEKEGYWGSELKPLVIGRLPRFEVVYNDAKEVICKLK